MCSPTWEWGEGEAGGRGSAKCLGQTMGTVCGGTGWGTPAGMCWPVWGFKRMAPLVVRSPAWGSLPGLAHLPPGVEGLDRPREGRMGRKSLGPPPQASLGLESDGGGAPAFPPRLTC